MSPSNKPPRLLQILQQDQCPPALPSPFTARDASIDARETLGMWFWASIRCREELFVESTPSRFKLTIYPPLFVLNLSLPPRLRWRLPSLVQDRPLLWGIPFKPSTQGEREYKSFSLIVESTRYPVLNQRPATSTGIYTSLAF